MKKWILFLLILCCKISFAQKNIEVDTFDYSTIKYEHDVSEFPKFYFNTNPFQLIVNQPNLTVGYRINDETVIELMGAKIGESFIHPSPWGNGDACVSQLMHGYRFVIGLKTYTSDMDKNNTYVKFNLDYSYKIATKKLLDFTGSNESDSWVLTFNQKRFNLGLNCVAGYEYILFDYFKIDVYAGAGLKYMYLKTDRLEYYSNYNYGDGSQFTHLLFNKSNYILPTINIGMNIGFCF
ncbi:MAG: hypothetical protein RJA07_1308 [Bacteroidota bacterium]|jgi:hypothetical protein